MGWKIWYFISSIWFSGVISVCINQTILFKKVMIRINKKYSHESVWCQSYQIFDQTEDPISKIIKTCNNM